MSMPFYVAPEQMMKDRADYARKGIARGRALVAVEFADGVVFVSENPSRSLYKTSEIYDRIGFAAVGKYNEFESMRVAGIRLADVKGYQYAREDVAAKSLANAYSQALGNIFMGEQKPYEVELLIAQVNAANGDGSSSRGPATPLELYHILYDGSIVDEQGFVALGGEGDELADALEAAYEEEMGLAGAVQTGLDGLNAVGDREVQPADLEVSGLDRTRGRRKFFRIRGTEIEELLAPDEG